MDTDRKQLAELFRKQLGDGEDVVPDVLEGRSATHTEPSYGHSEPAAPTASANPAFLIAGLVIVLLIGVIMYLLSRPSDPPSKPPPLPDEEDEDEEVAQINHVDEAPVRAQTQPPASTRGMPQMGVMRPSLRLAEAAHAPKAEPKGKADAEADPMFQSID